MRQRENKTNRKAVTILLSLVFVIFWVSCQAADDTREYYIDSISGDDQNSGTSENSPWKTLEKVSSKTFLPGDRVYFKRGSSYSGCVTINGDGNADNPIIIGAYGSGDAPSFTNPDNTDHKGNAMRIRGDYHIVENLYFHHTAPAPPSAGFETVWSVGALHVSLGHDHVIIRNNEFANTPKAIQSYSEYSLITNNYIHDGNSSQFNGFLSRPYWGPIGIQLGIGNQEVSYNTIENMYVVGGKWGGDGSAMEIDDGRNHKDNIHIHHNTTEHNMGFLEISWWHDFGKMSSTNVTIDHNVSRDYQQFVLWWAPTSASTIENNTIIRADNEFYGPFDGVFFFDARPADVTLTRNIVVTDNDLTEAIFVQDYDGGIYDVTHTNNCYWDVADGNPDIGLPLGPGEIIIDPLFVDYAGKDYDLQPGSPAAGLGALNHESIEDAQDTDAREAQRTDFETEEDEEPREASLAPASETGDWVRLEDTDPLLGFNGGDTWLEHRNSEGTTRTLWERGDSLTLLFEGSQVRFYGLKSDYMVTANILIDGVLVAENVNCSGDDEFQALLWESKVLEQGIHTVGIISNGDTVEVGFIEYK